MSQMCNRFYFRPMTEVGALGATFKMFSNSVKASIIIQ